MFQMSWKTCMSFPHERLSDTCRGIVVPVTGLRYNKQHNSSVVSCHASFCQVSATFNRLMRVCHFCPQTPHSFERVLLLR